MDTDANTCYTSANWAIMDLTGDICKVTPFLDLYKPGSEVPVAMCGAVWTSLETGKDYLLVANQMLLFGMQLPNSLLNPNQLCASGVNFMTIPLI
jgi:hypothetical protein